METETRYEVSVNGTVHWGCGTLAMAERSLEYALTSGSWPDALFTIEKVTVQKEHLMSVRGHSLKYVPQVGDIVRRAGDDKTLYTVGDRSTNYVGLTEWPFSDGERVGVALTEVQELFRLVARRD